VNVLSDIDNGASGEASLYEKNGNLPIILMVDLGPVAGRLIEITVKVFADGSQIVDRPATLFLIQKTFEVYHSLGGACAVDIQYANSGTIDVGQKTLVVFQSTAAVCENHNRVGLC